MDDTVSKKVKKNLNKNKKHEMLALCHKIAADPRLSLFITHGGMNSILESMFYNKPMIVVPLFGDQQMNSRVVQKRGIGVIIEKNLLNKETLTEAIRKTLQNKEISQESSFIASLLTGRPKKYRQDIARWARVITGKRGKFNHLRLNTATMSLVQYFCLDVIALVVVLSLLMFHAFLWIARSAYSCLTVVKSKCD
ncbi:hypothetical protein DICVIV_08820 [Dictyocaulus viviparus]|uniref:glucuronosyltransferase n=1 Tax=Dictyocaulus viviparus TaxID=29172 RepID=A0A0D8XKQ1_DICVI|nr:hypothetical protein DICVIV_08820 [Dictyocaulus viviparus]